LLADQQYDPNAQNNDGDTPLHIACYCKFPNIIRLLLWRSCSINIPNKKGETAEKIPLNKDGDCLLHLACQWDDVLIIEHLIASCVNIPLHIAVEHYNTNAPLLFYGCNPNIQNRKGDTPLHTAARLNKIAALSMLLTQQCNPNAQNEEGDTPLHIAVRDRYVHRHEEIVTKLLSCGKCNPDIQNSEGDTPLHIAVRMYKTAECDAPLDISRYFPVIALLLERKCGINIPNKKGEIAQEMPLNEYGDCLLHLACRYSNEDISGYIITYLKPNPNPIENVDVVHLLTACEECNPNILNREGDTPLHIAAGINKTAALSQLLDNKHCNPNAQNKKGDTPLHIAVRNRYVQHEEIISKLLSCGNCNPDIQNGEGDTPLHIAVRWNNTAALSQLLDHKHCNPNAQNKEGDTPLHIAVTDNQTAAISKILAHKKCNLNAQN